MPESFKIHDPRAWISAYSSDFRFRIDLMLDTILAFQGRPDGAYQFVRVAEYTFVAIDYAANMFCKMQGQPVPAKRTLKLQQTQGKT